MIYSLDPGYIYASDSGVVIRTVVGNCIAVGLWDRQKKVGGMNHFRYPESVAATETTASFGDGAMKMLIRLMERLGCDQATLVAQIFGGAAPRNDKKNTLGVRNLEVARKILTYEKILVVSEDTGGFLGRKIMFDTSSGHALVLKVSQLRDSDWVVSDS